MGTRSRRILELLRVSPWSMAKIARAETVKPPHVIQLNKKYGVRPRRPQPTCERGPICTREEIKATLRAGCWSAL